MKPICYVAVVAFGATLLLAGCGHKADKGNQPEQGKASTPENEDLKVARAQLNEEDRQLVEAQEFCAIQTENRLGEMGPPVKVMIKDQAVFLCCKGCQKKALADPEKTLVKVVELKAKVKEAAPRK